MSDHFSPEEIKYIARLARLTLSDADVSYFASDINEILRYVRKLNELDTDEVEPLAHIIPLKNVWREDEVKESLPVDEVLSNTKYKRNSMFKVPRVIEE
ncbi:MAG: Asp-tRNA(Asn)/Glu-tRNA(Gln) amidotransferase subunit GatC [Candidatus Tritonobacter lacicola]|nr:Asp-tRNA(Asn)/Glu-tRNA(Gln) amidotransferase subunit GatC [Candidatus Tritonobacter lacicola]